MVKHSSLSRSWLFEAVFERVLLCVSGVNITMVSSRDKAPDFSLGADHPINDEALMFAWSTFLTYAFITAITPGPNNIMS